MSETKQTPIKEWIESLKYPPSVRLYNTLMYPISNYFPTKESLLKQFQESPKGGKIFLLYKKVGWKTVDELCRLLEVPLLPRPVRKKAKRKEFFKKDEIIHIGQLLKSVDDFNSRIRLNEVPDAKKKDRVYVQARSYSIINKKKTFISTYVGKKDQYTHYDLEAAINTLKYRYATHVNQQLSAYNCQIEDFK